MDRNKLRYLVTELKLMQLEKMEELKKLAETMRRLADLETETTLFLEEVERQLNEEEEG